MNQKVLTMFLWCYGSFPSNKTLGKDVNSMKLSDELLKEIKTWSVVPIPMKMFHGCRSDDYGIDIPNLKIMGNKWSSIAPSYAGDYAWHQTRNHTALPYILELHATKELKAIERPLRLIGEFIWPQFLKKCFPLYSGYELSKQFEQSLCAHITEVFGNSINGYVAFNNEEIIVTNSEKYLRVKKCLELPMEKDDYRKIRSNVFSYKCI